jgi:hypothetical protein
MPWNSLHLVIPLSVLAAIGVVVSVTHATRWVRYLAIAGAAITALISLHNAFTIAYVTGAQPVEYYVYVQTTPDVPEVYNEMQRIQAHLNGPLHIQVDNDDTWPWAFYLRDSKQWWIDSYPGSADAFGVPTQPVLFVSDDHYSQISAQLAVNYVAIHEHLRWWNPEEYKTYNQAGVSPWSNFTHFLHDAFTPSTWLHIMQWEIQRRPFTPGAWDNFNNSTNFYFLVRKEYVQYLSPALQAQVKAQEVQQQQKDPFLALNKPLQAGAVVAGVGAGPRLSMLTVAPIAANAAGDVLAGDITAHKIVHVGPNGAFAGSWGSAGNGPGQFSNDPRSPSIGGIAYAPNGDIYATDTWNGRVEEFTPAGKFIRAWGQLSQDPADTKPYDLFGPRGIAVAPNGDVYVADTGHEIVKVFSATGSFLLSFGGQGITPAKFNEPSSVAIDSAGNVYVADYWNQRIQVLTAQGQFLRAIPVNSWQVYSYHEPQIAVDAQARVYAPDPATSRVLVFSATGQPLLAFGSYGLGLNQLNQPLGVAVGPHNTILVSDAGNTRVLRFTVP